MMHHIRALWGALRNAAAYAVVTRIDDTGGAQMVDVITGTNVRRANVEVMQPFGFGANAPADGAVTKVVALGGDPSNLVALPPSNPSARFGDLAPGEAVLYGADGSRVHVRAGRIEIWTVREILLNGQAVQVSGDLTAGGAGTFGGTLTAPLFRGHTTIWSPCASGVAENDFISTPDGDVMLFPEPDNG